MNMTLLLVICTPLPIDRALPEVCGGSAVTIIIKSVGGVRIQRDVAIPGGAHIKTLVWAFKYTVPPTTAVTYNFDGSDSRTFHMLN